MKILLVDDDPELVMIASYALEKVGGFEVEHVSNGEEAVTRAVTLKPDAILLDCVLGDMDGPQVLVRLHQEMGERLCPVIFLTAKSSAELHEDLLRSGAKGVIQKPFDPLELSNQVRRIIDSLQD